MGTTESISVFQLSERLAEIKDQPSPSSLEEKTPIAFRHAPPNPISGLVSGEESAVAAEHLSIAAAGFETNSKGVGILSLGRFHLQLF
jgi:hypothetical protein